MYQCLTFADLMLFTNIMEFLVIMISPEHLYLVEPAAGNGWVWTKTPDIDLWCLLPPDNAPNV